MVERGEAIILCVTSLGRSCSEPSLRETSGLNHARWICIQPFVKIQFALREKGLGGELRKFMSQLLRVLIWRRNAKWFQQLRWPKDGIWTDIVGFILFLTCYIFKLYTPWLIYKYSVLMRNCTGKFNFFGWKLWLLKLKFVIIIMVDADQNWKCIIKE